MIYKFYQFWFNTSDEDAEKYIKIFTFLDEDTIKEIIAEHDENRGLKSLQRRLAEEVTRLVHSEQGLLEAQDTSNVLFSKNFKEDIEKLDLNTLNDVFSDVEQAQIPMADIEAGLDMIAALSAKTQFLKSNGEARRSLKENSISVNKSKVDENYMITAEDLIGGTYVVLNKGKRNTYIIKAI